VIVANGAKFSGRYLKYLTKKFLKKQNVFPRGGLELISVEGLVESYFHVKGGI
jgi:hypothetical protein